MQSFATTGAIDLSDCQDKVRRDFAAKAVSEEEVTETIRDFYRQHNYILDPHTAVGVSAAHRHKKEGVPMVCLATAHPAKFGEAVEHAIGRQPDLPASLADIMNRPSRCELMDADANQIQDYLQAHARHG